MTSSASQTFRPRSLTLVQSSDEITHTANTSRLPWKLGTTKQIETKGQRSWQLKPSYRKKSNTNSFVL